MDPQEKQLRIAAIQQALSQKGGGQPQAPQQNVPRETMGQGMMRGAEEIAPYVGGALGGMLGTGAGAASALGTGGAATPWAATMPFIGAGLGYGATKSGIRALKQTFGKEAPGTLGQNMGAAANDVGMGMGMELMPLAAAKGAKAVLGVGGKVAETVLPGLLRVTANVPQEATKYALEHPGEVLKMTAPEASQAISRTVELAREGFGRFIAQKQEAMGNRLNSATTAIGSNIRKAGEGLAEGLADAERRLVKERATQGVYTTASQKVANVLGRKTAAAAPEQALQGLDTLAKDVTKMEPMQAFRKLADFDQNLQKMMGNTQDTMTAVALGSTRNRIQAMIQKLPIDPELKAQELAFRQGMDQMTGLQKVFTTPGKTADVKQIAQATDFLTNNAHRMEPKEAYKAALATRMAIDKGMPADMTGQDAAFVNQQRATVNGIMERIPGMDRLKRLDKMYAGAAEADRMLSDAFTSPTKTKNFLNKVFSGEDPQSPELMEKLLALEKRTGQPFLQKLQRLWEEKKIVESAKFPFENEFTDPGSTEKFMHGLFADGRTDPASRFKLSQVKKILGTQLVDEMFKGFAADAFHQPNMRSYVANRVIGGAATTAAMMPFTGGTAALPYLAGTAAMGGLASRGVMKGAMKAGIGAGNMADSAVAATMKPQMMKIMTALEVLKNRRKQED